MDWLLGSGVWTDWFFLMVDWFRAMGPYVWIAIAWGILLMAIFLGLVGVVVPVIPGGIVLFFGGLVHKVMVSEGFSWWAIGILGGLMVLDRVVDLFATALGTKWFGGTTWGMIGALVGGVVGLFLGIVGILIGPIIGAVVFELIWAKRHPRDAAKSGVGAGLGLGLSAAGRLVVYFMMLGTLIVDYSMDDEVEPVEEPIEIVGEVV
ncbi:MAG: DUF456 domain-containing protein [Opitutaceae bacterium]|nr:DUF456 domain-containing protein [Opitutaceae bacterium]